MAVQKIVLICNASGLAEDLAEGRDAEPLGGLPKSGQDRFIESTWGRDKLSELVEEEEPREREVW